MAVKALHHVRAAGCRELAARAYAGGGKIFP